MSKKRSKVCDRKQVKETTKKKRKFHKRISLLSLIDGTEKGIKNVKESLAQLEKNMAEAQAHYKAEKYRHEGMLLTIEAYKKLFEDANTKVANGVK